MALFQPNLNTHMYSTKIHMLTILGVLFQSIHSITFLSTSLKFWHLRNFWTALAIGFWGRSFQIISSLVRRSSIVDGLLPSSFCLRDCKIVMLTTYITNLIPKLVINATSLMPCFYLSTGWRSSKTGYTPLQWLYCKAWMATKLATSSSAWLSCVECHAESWISQAGQMSHQQSRSFKQDWRWLLTGLSYWVALHCLY